MNIPGRGYLRVSLTPRCNLKCSFCHNEGQAPPWQADSIDADPEMIGQLIAACYDYGLKAVVFTGGDPGSYKHLEQLLTKQKQWKKLYPNITKWGLVTNGIPFLNLRRLDLLMESSLTHVTVSIDNMYVESRPSSPNCAVRGFELLDNVALPLKRAGKHIKIDAVFTGEIAQSVTVATVAHYLDFDCAVIQVNGVMGIRSNNHGQFAYVQALLAAKFKLKLELDPITNEVNLKGDKSTIKFYPDRCSYRDCNTCRKVDFRVNSKMEAVPCFLQSRSTIKLVNAGIISTAQLEQAIEVNGTGPEWYNE